jgi:hypothetical protein
MMLARISPAGKGLEKRSFECNAITPIPIWSLRTRPYASGWMKSKVGVIKGE